MRLFVFRVSTNSGVESLAELARGPRCLWRVVWYLNSGFVSQEERAGRFDQSSKVTECGMHTHLAMPASMGQFALGFTRILSI